MAQVKPALTLDVSVGSSSHVGIGGSGTSTTPRAHQSAVNNKIQNHIQASTYGPSDYATAHDQSYDNEFEAQPDNGGFSSDDDAQDVYATATSRLKAGSSSSGAKATRGDAHMTPQSRYQRGQNTIAEASHYGPDAEDDLYGHDDYAQNGPYHHHQVSDGIHDEMVYEDEDDGEDIEDDESDLSSSPSIPDENIDFDLVYALHNFVATVEGQATVHKGNSLTLLDDSNSYWWLVRVLRTQEVGYIPAENIETPFERLARLNKHRNVDLTSATDDDHIQVPEKIFTSHLVKARNASGTNGVSPYSGKLSALSRRAQGAPAPLTKEQRRNKRGVVFGPSTYLEHSADEYSDYDEEGEEHDLEYEEDPDAIYEDEDEDEDGEHEIDPEHQGQHGPAVGFNKMEPDDGMDWDAQEAERIQQQKQGAMRADQQQNRSVQPPAADMQQQQQQPMSHPYAQQYTPNQAGPSQGPMSQGQQQWNNGNKMQEQSRYQQQAQRQQQYRPQDGPNGDAHQMHANGRSSISPQQSRPNYGPLQSNNRITSEQMRAASGERSVSSINSSGPMYDAQGRPISSAMSRNSSSSSNGFLPSHLQRERTNSDASANSTVIAGESSNSSDREKRKGNRGSKGSDSLDGDEKSGKKHTGVFSLFSRKDKKDRKNSAEERDGMAGISSEDSYSSYATRKVGPGGPNAGPVNPVVQAANAGLQPGQSIGMGHAVQERDRATQEAYQRQFLTSQNGNYDSQATSPTAMDDKKKFNQRPGSLVGPSGTTPMLSVLRVFAGEGVDSDSTFKTVLLNDSTTSIDLQRQALQRFGVKLHDMDKYVLTIKRLEGDERPLDEDERPLQLFNTLTEILQQGRITVPSVKRSSVGSISSISSNLSTHPAIARLGNDFSDDHAVKFYISRRDRLQGYVDLSNSHVADESGRSPNMPADLSVSQDNSNVSSLDVDGQEATRSSNTSVLVGESNDQSPTARFALRLVIYAADLPEGIVFDPRSNALIPAATLRERMPASPDAASQHRFREKILTFPRNTTVAEVVEEGLDRFGIAEGVVEGGDDVEDRPSRRKSRLHVKYGLAVQAADGERALAPTSKVLEAYPTPPVFKTTSGKRRSIDAASLLGASDDVGPNDPVFVLRQITHAHHGHKSKLNPASVGGRVLSPTNGMLAAAHEARQLTPQPSPRMGASRDLQSARPAAAQAAKAPTPQEIIAAQRAAAAERNAAVLGAQRNAQQGVDVVLSNQARIRSSKLGSNKFRYSYIQTDGQEKDISTIIEDVMREAAQIRPGLVTKPSDLTTATTTTDADYASARSDTGVESPLSLKEVNFEIEGTGTAPLSLGRRKTPENQIKSIATVAAEGDLLGTLLRGAGAEEGDAVVEERINAVLERVETRGVNGSRSVSAPVTSVHKKQLSTGSEISTRDTSSPLTVGTSSATHTTGTMLTPMSTVNARTQPHTMRSASAGAASSRSVTPSAYPSVAALTFGADDASLSHLYTIVEAAARRDPRRQRLLSHASISSISSTTSPILGGGSGASGSRPGSKLSISHASKLSALLEDESQALKPEVGGLFAPNMPFVEDSKVRQAYGGISRQLGDIDDSLDSLLADVIRIF